MARSSNPANTCVSDQGQSVWAAISFSKAMKNLFPTLAAFASLSLVGAANAAGIAWYNNDSDPLPMIQADGTYLDDSFTFELGVFASGFDPTANAYSTWAANWRTLDKAYAPAANGWSSVAPGAPGHDILDPLQPAYNEQYVTSELTFDIDGTVQGLPGSSTFSVGETAWLWVYNTQSVGSTTQWALIRDDSADFNPVPISPNWVLPNPVNDTAPSVNWNIEEGDLAVFGAINNVSSGIARGAGSYSSDLGGAFRLQTTLIPEPGSAFLILATGLSLQLRRHRRRDTLSVP
jgi:hypothetical protein